MSFEYDKDVTITGYIHSAEDEENNQDHPFSLTVFAGNLTAETADDYYETDATGTAAVTVATIEPYPHSWQVEAPNSLNPFDSVGLKHNLGIINCLNQTSGSWVVRSANYLKNLYPNLDYDSLVMIATEGADVALNDSTNYAPTNMSTLAQNYSSQLISTIDNLQESSVIEQAINNIKGLESNILNSNIADSEKVALLSACSVARYSMYFWLENTDSTDVLSFRGDMMLYNYVHILDASKAGELIHVVGPSAFDNDEYLANWAILAYSTQFKKG